MLGWTTAKLAIFWRGLLFPQASDEYPKSGIITIAYVTDVFQKKNALKMKEPTQMTVKNHSLTALRVK